MLTDRLRSLERAEIVERRIGPTGKTLKYWLTPAGRDLEPVVQAIGEWGATWSFTDPRPQELDPDLLIVWMARHVDRDRLPRGRTVVQFDLRDPTKRYWMVVEPSEVSVCLQHPGSDVDLEVRVDTATLYRLSGARRAGRRDAGTQADDERPEGAPTGLRALVRLERVRPGQPRGRRAPYQIVRGGRSGVRAGTSPCGVGSDHARGPCWRLALGRATLVSVTAASTERLRRLFRRPTCRPFRRRRADA